MATNRGRYIHNKLLPILDEILEAKMSRLNPVALPV